jgi:Domain of unknown function (DUF1707)
VNRCVVGTGMAPWAIMTSGEPPPIRVGNDERSAAMAALDEHLAKGRLGVEEYGDRSAAAANAVVVSDLAALFTDLPPPHPTLPGVAPPEPVPVTYPDRTRAARGGLMEVWGPRLMAASPILALLLFLATRQWWMFLLIPLIGMITYGSGGRRDGTPRS